MILKYDAISVGKSDNFPILCTINFQLSFMYDRLFNYA